MLTKKLQFLRPARELREFYVLSAVERNPGTSQREIARSSFMSSTMVNNYLGEMVSHEWIDIQGETNRSYSYKITPLGVQHKQEILFQLSKEVVQVFAIVKHDFTARLRRLADEGVKRIVVFGAAETGELTCAAAPDAGLEVVGIVDNDAAKHGHRLAGHEIQGPDAIGSMRPDAIVIASHGHAEAMYRQVEHLEESGIKVVRI